MTNHGQQLSTSRALVRRDPTDLVVRSNGEIDRTIQMPPTPEASAQWQHAYGYFNRHLFGGVLPDCMIVYSRKKSSYGHFAPDRFQSLDGRLVPELALNAVYLATRPDRESLGTLVHEQAHVFRHYFGPVGRSGKVSLSGYHDMAWVRVMERIGLTPSDTGQPGGHKTGYQMTHYIAEGGPFDLACQALLVEGFRINWADRTSASNSEPSAAQPLTSAPSAPAKKDRIKFSCPGCNQNAWAKPGAQLACARCGFRLQPDEGAKR